MARSGRAAAFTRKDLMVVIAVFFAMGVFLIPALRRAGEKSRRLDCICHLKVMGTAYRLWANDHGDRYPAFTPQTNDGWSEILYRTNASTYAWTNYAIMSNELGESPLTLVCPADERRPANSFSNLANTNISYFVGINASDSYPQALLGGDRNLGPGTTPDSEYGFSPANGRGNDVIIHGPVCWSLKMHSRGNRTGAGNILLGDGSVQQVLSANLNGNWLKNSATEQAAHDKSTNSAGMRLVFP